jgi:hypothetical protein
MEHSVNARENLEKVRAAIAAAEAEAGRESGAVRLVAVSKTKSADEIRPVIEAGQRVFGENRVQEAQSKWPGLKAEAEGIGSILRPVSMGAGFPAAFATPPTTVSTGMWSADAKARRR